MIRIKRFNEALGIAEPTLFHSDIINMKVMDCILDFIHRNINSTKEINETKNIIISYNEIKPFVTDWFEYSYFPVSEIDLVVILSTNKELKGREVVIGNTITKKDVPFKLGAFASSFGGANDKDVTKIKDPIKMNNDHSISLHMGIEVDFGQYLNEKKYSKKLEIDVDSAILHELNHLYEFYNREMYQKKPVNFSLTWATIGENVMKRPKDIYNYWLYNFGLYIYRSEQHEVNASVQEAKPFVDRLDFNNFKKTKIYEEAKHMENFDYKDFLIKLNKIIARHNPEYCETMVNTLVKDFKLVYKNLTKELKEKPIEDFDKMSNEQFFEYWQAIIRKSGQTLIKKMSRLYAYKDIKQSEVI